jgi:twitching motility protein PilT
MLANSAVRNLLREGKIYQLANAIRTSHEEGMVSLDEALVDLYLRRVITMDMVYKFCNDRKEVEAIIGGSKMKAMI